MKRGGLLVRPSAPYPAKADERPMYSGADVSWLPKCLVGDDQGQVGACAIFSLASWSEIMTGKAISNAECIRVYRAACKELGRGDEGLYFNEAFRFAPKSWFPGRTKIVRASLNDLSNQPLIAGYKVTPSWEKLRNGVFHHRAGNHDLGYHAVVVVGRGQLAANKGRWVWIENSWGVGWGFKGLGMMTLSLHNEMCRELYKLV